MQLLLAGFLGVGILERNIGIVVNCGVALAATELPAILERDYQVPMDPALVLWLTVAVFLHGLGTLGPYRTVWWWDHITHALSASIVGGAGYATARAMDRHAADIHLPPRFLFVFILLITLAFGVLWEVLEFGIGKGAAAVGTETVLTQYGLDDSMLDLVFDTMGAVLVATFGTAYLGGVIDALAAQLARREQGRE
ncbi:MAG: hypothetical protein ABEJ35_07925 [Halobacteriaceae archaeon]